MSEKKSKLDRKLKAIEGNGKDVDWRQAADEQAKQIRHMIEDRDEKAVNAKRHLEGQLEITVEKYRTANGVMVALDTVRQVMGRDKSLTLHEQIAMAKAMATNMAVVTQRLVEIVRQTEVEKLDEICDDLYDKEFSQHDSSLAELVEELMVLNLCQNVGPDAQDVVEFCKTTDDEIDKARTELRKYCKEHDLDYLDVCGYVGQDSEKIEE